MTPTMQQFVDHGNWLIQNETRPQSEQNLYSVGADAIKVSQIESVSAVPLVGGVPLHDVQLRDEVILNSGNTAWGKLYNGPLTEAAINQGMRSDCYLLVALLMSCLRWPDLINDLVVFLDDKTAVVQYYIPYSNSGPYVLQVTCSLLVSVDYDHPANGDPRPQLVEKTFSLVRRMVSDFIKPGDADYTLIDWGNISNPMMNFGLDTIGTIPNFTTLATAVAQGKACGLQTSSSASGTNSLENWVASHAYGVSSVDANRTLLTMLQPWYANRPITGVSATDISVPGRFNFMVVGTLPATRRLSAANVKLPTPPPKQTYNFADFVLVSNHYGMKTLNGAADGDFNLDGVVNFADYVLLSNNYAGAELLPIFFQWTSGPTFGIDNILRGEFDTDADQVLFDTGVPTWSPVGISGNKLQMGFPATGSFAAKVVLKKSGRPDSFVSYNVRPPALDDNPVIATYDLHKDLTLTKRTA